MRPFAGEHLGASADDLTYQPFAGSVVFWTIRAWENAALLAAMRRVGKKRSGDA